jgi:outer membrane lipoprotein carrier protein
MRVLLGLVCALGVLSAADAREELAAVVARYRKVTTISGEFAQRICSEQLGYDQELEGRFYFARPSRFRFEVTCPVKQIMVGDSAVTWLYWPDSNLVHKLARTPNPFFEILLNSSAGSFTPESLGRLEDGSTMLTLLPRDSLAAIRRIRLRLEPKTRSITDIRIDDGLGNDMRYSLTKLIYNSKLPAGLFEFKPPPGAVVEE